MQKYRGQPLRGQRLFRRHQLPLQQLGGPRVRVRLPIDDAGSEQKGVSGRKDALPEDVLRQEKERARGAQPADGKRGWVNPCRLQEIAFRIITSPRLSVPSHHCR